MRIVVDFGVPVDGVQVEQQSGAGRDVVVVGSGGSVRFPGRGERGGRVQTESLLDDGLEEGEIGEVGFEEETRGADDGVELELRLVD